MTSTESELRNGGIAEGGSKTPFIEKSVFRRVAWAAWFLLLILGGLGLYMRLTQGHLPAGYGSYVPWGLWIALYFHGIGIAGGVFAVAAAGQIFEIPGLNARWLLRSSVLLSAAAIAAGMFSVLLDLGHMTRAHHIFLAPSFSSMMAFNAWMYNVFIAVAFIAAVLSFRADSGWYKPVLILGLVVSQMIPSQSGAFFGVVGAKAFWHNAMFPVMFLVGSLTVGAAMLLLIRVLYDDGAENAARGIRTLRNIILAGIGIYFFLEFAELSISYWNPAGDHTELDLLLFGPYWWVFWILLVGLGGTAATILLSMKRRVWNWPLAAFLVSTCFVAGRLNVLIPGQAVAELKGLQDAFHHPRLSYIYDPTMMEYLVGLLLVAIGVAVFFIGQRFLSYVSRRFNPAEG